MSDEFKKIDETSAEEVSGGAGYYNGIKIVTGLQSGYLALRTAPGYDYNNEIRGCELYNGDKVNVIGPTSIASDGRPYCRVYSPKSNREGYVNANYLSVQ